MIYGEAWNTGLFWGEKQNQDFYVNISWFIKSNILRTHHGGELRSGLDSDSQFVTSASDRMKEVLFTFTFLELDSSQVLRNCVLNNESLGTPRFFIGKIWG